MTSRNGSKGSQNQGSPKAQYNQEFSSEFVSGDNNNMTRNVAATNDQEDNNLDLGWIGLIGLAGLLGLRRRDDKR